MDNDFEITGSFFDYGSKINFSSDRLESFRKAFGQIGLFCRAWCYSPKNKKKHYFLKMERYQEYYDAIEKSLEEKTDYLFDLVKDDELKTTADNKIWY